jgi:light-regulated signal transduction histidine kinase (bacteriophytochrome)
MRTRCWSGSDYCGLRSAVRMAADEELTAALREIAELQSALEQCSAAQKRAEEAAERAGSELRDFVYAAGHDLQEPLRAVSSFSQLLQRKYAEDPETSEMTGLIIDGASRATALVQALLAYSRTGNAPQVAMVNLSDALQPALFKLGAEIRASGATISCGELPEVLADEVQLAQVFEQLVKNAIAFRSREPVRIEITAEEASDAHIVSVRDNGKGIEPRFQEFIFLPFKRLHGKEVPGAGLGLAVCRKIIAAHGGRMWVESDGESGSTFKFTLPY